VRSREYEDCELLSPSLLRTCHSPLPINRHSGSSATDPVVLCPIQSGFSSTGKFAVSRRIRLTSRLFAADVNRRRSRRSPGRGTSSRTSSDRLRSPGVQRNDCRLQVADRPRDPAEWPAIVQYIKGAAAGVVDLCFFTDSGPSSLKWSAAGQTTAPMGGLRATNGALLRRPTRGRPILRG